MSRTSGRSKVIPLRLPNEIVYTLECRVNGRRSRWESIGEYIKEMVIFHVERSHKKRIEPTTLQELKAKCKGEQ